MTAVSGYKIKKGQWLAVPVFSIHNNPKYWEDAEVFLPERWIEGHPESAKQPQPSSAYLPFGEGPRICVGMRFALQEAKLTLLRIYQKFTLELTPGQVSNAALAVLDALVTLAFASKNPLR